MSGSVWYYVRGGQQFGPVTEAELKARVADGTIGPDDFVWRDGLKDWLKAGQVRGLFAPVGAAEIAAVVAPPTAPSQPTRSCPYCGEQILAVAQKCKHCGEWLRVGYPSSRIWPIKLVAAWNIPFFLLLTLNIYWLFWLYRIVRELNDREAIDVTPGKAVGFCFIPFFNLVWVFVVWGKIGKALLTIHDRNGLPPPAAGVVWIAPVGVIAGFLFDLAAMGTGLLINLTCLSIVMCIVQTSMNRIAHVAETAHLRQV